VDQAPLSLPLTNDQLLAGMVAVSFAAGLNLSATIATLGILARTGVLDLPPQLALLSNEWVIGASLVLFVIEFFADKIPVFDLVWSVLQTVIKVPAAALLAWASTSALSPGAQLAASALGGVIALAAHSGKLALRGAATTSPEPASNIVLSLAEDAVAIGLTWFAAAHPYLAAAIAIALLAATILVIVWAWKLVTAGGRRLRDYWLSRDVATRRGP
jgi:hypothetical protein